MSKYEGVVIVPVRMDGEYAKMLINIKEYPFVDTLMKFNSESKIRYANLHHKYCKEISDMQMVTNELPFHNTKWIVVSYLPEPLEELYEGIHLYDGYHELYVIDYVGPMFYINKNEKHPEGAITYIDYKIPNNTKRLCLLNIDNQMDDKYLSELDYLKNIFDSDTDLKVINLNGK